MESRIAIPYVSGITWQLNKVNVQDVVQTQAGPRNVNYESEPHIAFEVTSYIANRDVGTIKYVFPKENKEDQDAVTMSSLLDSVDSDVLETWSTVILDEMANTFPVLADQPQEMLALGTPRYLRLDMIRVSIPYSGSKAVTATVGIYLDQEYTQPVRYLELVFADGNSIRMREAELSRLNEMLTENQTILDSDQSTQQQKDQATINIYNINNRTVELNDQLVANLIDLFSKESVVKGAKDLVKGLFTIKKQTDPTWSNINVATLMGLFTLPNVV